MASSLEDKASVFVVSIDKWVEYLVRDSVSVSTDTSKLDRTSVHESPPHATTLLPKEAVVIVLSMVVFEQNVVKEVTVSFSVIVTTTSVRSNGEEEPSSHDIGVITAVDDCSTAEVEFQAWLLFE
jgi:hypothetical protein